VIELQLARFHVVQIQQFHTDVGATRINGGIEEEKIIWLVLFNGFLPWKQYVLSCLVKLYKSKKIWWLRTCYGGAAALSRSNCHNYYRANI